MPRHLTKPSRIHENLKRLISGRRVQNRFVDSDGQARLLVIVAILIAATAGLLSIRHYLGRADDTTVQKRSIQVDAVAAGWELRQVRASLTGKVIAGAERPAATISPCRCEVFLTVSASKQGTSTPSRISSHGAGASVDEALAAALKAMKENSRNTDSCRDPGRIELDVVQNGDSGGYEPIDKPDEANGSASDIIEPGREGIRIESDGHYNYLLPSALIYDSILANDPQSQTASDLLARACVAAGLASNAWESNKVKLSTFRTISYIEDAGGNSALPLVSAFIPWASSVNRNTLISAARAGGDYLVRMQRPDGSFYYWYDAANDQPDAVHYNIIRHAGAVHALFQLYAATGEASYLSAAEKSAGYLKQQIKPFKGSGGDDSGSTIGQQQKSASAFYVPEANDSKTKLGANGLALVVLVDEMKASKKQDNLNLAKGLAEMILLMQKKDGSFGTSYYVAGDGPEEPDSLYYPGEAMLGLIGLYEITGDKTLLTAVRRGSDFLVNQEKQQTTLPPDAWFAQVLEKLYGLTNQSAYAVHAVDLAMSMVDSQYSDGARPEFVGAIAPGTPRAVQTSARAEGVVAGYRVAKKTSDARASKLLAGLESSARFQLSQQFTEDNSFFLPNPTRSLGGIRESITSMRIRIDYVQHTISALLGLSGCIN